MFLDPGAEEYTKRLKSKLQDNHSKLFVGSLAKRYAWDGKSKQIVKDMPVLKLQLHSRSHSDPIQAYESGLIALERTIQDSLEDSWNAGDTSENELKGIGLQNSAENTLNACK